MISVFDCIAYEHNLWLVLLAGLICAAGSWVAAHVYFRATQTIGLQRAGWYFLTALAAGAAIWCTHFIAMLGFESGVPVSFDPVLTILSLVIAVIGSTVGFAVGGMRFSRFAPALGGAFVGLAVAAMHYTGMAAYRVQGIVSWEMSYLVASIILAVLFATLATHVALTSKRRDAVNWSAAALALAILSLHFTGMTAFRVQPLLVEPSVSNPDALLTLALVTTCMAAVIVAAGLVSYILDRSVRAESFERLRKMALSDVLTGLPNRANFNETLKVEIATARDGGTKLAVIAIDLNRFKAVNDLRGHQTGDEVLRRLGQRIQALLKQEIGEFVARTGGDEFTAICRVNGRASLPDFLMRLEQALFKTIKIDNFEVSPGASFGVAIYPDDASDQTLLINNADLAMYRAKSDPSQIVCYYEAGMDEAVRARRSLAGDLRNALVQGELFLHFQKQSSITTGEIRGYEALLRWEHPRHGLIPPDEFIPIAEEDGLIVEIGEWVLRRACVAAMTWDPALKVAVNISAVQLAQVDLSQFVKRVLQETGLAPERLELELTETTIVKDKERTMHTLRKLRETGVSVALDDFGTGYSSLETLRTFAFDRIKIDRSFVAEIGSEDQSIAMIRAVLALAKALNIPVIAEGIETQEQFDVLKVEGCDEAQGFLLGRPVPLASVATGAAHVVSRMATTGFQDLQRMLGPDSQSSPMPRET